MDNRKRAEQLCLGIERLTGAPCTLLSTQPQAELLTAAPWFCTGHEGCVYQNTMHYGCSEAYRWNGKYVFYCPKGLVFVAASLADGSGNLAGGLVLGPLVMGEADDTLSLFEGDKRQEAVARLPQWDTAKVRHAEDLLSAVADSLSESAQGRYGSFVVEQEKMLSQLYEIRGELGEDATVSDSLIRREKELTALIAEKDKDGAQKLLNDILGYIFFTGNADVSTIKARLIEMLVLLSRSAIDAGAGIQEILLFNEGNIKQIENITSLEDLSAWITVIMRRFVQYAFDFSSVKHSDTMYKILQYIKSNYDQKITLDDVAAHVGLSRAYVSRVFREEMGERLFTYINRIRVDKSKCLLLNDSVPLVDVSALCGFEDQSYFTKVFKSLVGVSPKKYRDNRGKITKVG